MRWTPLLFVVSSLIFFAIFSGTQTFHPKHASPLARILPGIPTTQSPGAKLWKALVTGDDRDFSRAEKRVYYRLGLGHLFTPSGVHLATLQPFLRHLKLLPAIFTIIALVSCFLPGLQALARVAWVEIIPNGTKSLGLFMIIMLLEGIFISWKQHPLSWTCSWLFLGLSWFSPKKWRLMWFMLAQMLLCWVLVQPFSLFAPLANLLASFPLLVLFPLCLFLALVPSFFAHRLVEKALTVFHFSIMSFDRIHDYIPAILPHAGHLLLLISWLIIRANHRWILPVIWLLISAPTGHVRNFSPTISKWEIVPSPQAWPVSQEGQTTSWSDGVRCQRKWKGVNWEESCRPSRKKGDKWRTRKLSLNR